MAECVICQTVKREAVSWVVYETDIVICFLPLDANAYGHTIIAPQAHYADLYDIPETVLWDVTTATQRLSNHYRAAIDAAGVNLLHASGRDAQQSVPHFHWHLLPRFADDGMDAWPTLPTLTLDKDALLQRLRME